MIDFIRHQNPRGYVYCASPIPPVDDGIKIGSTHSPHDRLANFNTSSPRKWSGVFWHVEDYEQWEAKVLDRLRPYLVREAEIIHWRRFVSDFPRLVSEESDELMQAWLYVMARAICILSGVDISSFLTSSLLHKRNNRLDRAIHTLVGRSLIVSPGMRRPSLGYPSATSLPSWEFYAEKPEMTIYVWPAGPPKPPSLESLRLTLT